MADEKKADGGPAFARPYSYDPGTGPDDDSHEVAQAGMSLRDYFAAKAMQAQLAGESWNTDPNAVATKAYLFADAMLAERAKR